MSTIPQALRARLDEYCCEGVTIADLLPGAQALFDLLLEGQAEFDEAAFRAKWQHINPSDYQLVYIVAKEQHQQDQAQIAAARAEVREECERSGRIESKREVRIADLEQQLAEAKAELKDWAAEYPSSNDWRKERDRYRSAYETLFEKIKHGDADHQTWLKDAIAEHLMEKSE